jgi:hypothetical protein
MIELAANTLRSNGPGTLVCFSNVVIRKPTKNITRIFIASGFNIVMYYIIT